MATVDNEKNSRKEKGEKRRRSRKGERESVEQGTKTIQPADRQTYVRTCVRA